MRRAKDRTVSAATARTALAALGTLSLIAVAAPRVGAQTVEAQPGVTVDLGVLDDMGPPQTVPDLLFPGPHAPRSKLQVPSMGASRSDAAPRQPRMPVPDAKPRSRLNVQAVPGAVAPKPSPRQTAPAEPPAPAPATTSAPPQAPVSEPPARPDEPAAQTPSTAAPAPSSGPTPDDATSPPATTEAAPEPAAPATTPEAPQPPAVPEAEPTPEAPEPPTEAAPEPAAETADDAPASPAPTAPATATGDALTLTFAPDQTDLPSDAHAGLEAFAKRLQGNEALQVRVMAYASGDGDNASRARRTSLSRALAVRSYLMDQGIRSTRIEVRALGQPETGAADRVDVAMFTP